jgi:integrase
MPRPKRDVPWLEWRDGVAYVFWYDGQTRRLSLRTRDGREAQARFAAFLVEGDAITHPRADQITVERALDDYRREHVAFHCVDIRRQEDIIAHLKAFFGDRPLSAVDIPASRKYAAARRAHVTDSTIRRELGVLIAASNHARKWKRLTEMPSIEMTKDRTTGVDEEAAYFNKVELGRLMAEATGELRHFVDLAYWTGARRASIENLTRPQVKWEQRRLHLATPGKEATKKRQPIVPILTEMEPALGALWEASTHRERLFARQVFYWPFRELCEGLGFGDRSNPHMLRHSRATHLLQDGVSIFTVAKLLGDTVATVQRVYGHHSHEDLAKELEGR